MAIALVFALALASALVTAATAPGRSRAASQQAPQPSIAVTCTLANPAYAGDCVEKTTRTEKKKPAAACRPILDCLNNPNCVKNYCQATTIRQGWTLKKAN
jgi:hypothetical protein